MKKIGFCFLIYDVINNEGLWNLFFKDIDKSKYNIYVHYKFNKPLEHFEKYKLKKCIATKYADVSLIHAHNLLFRKAYEDNCCKIISLSQACIPLKSFDYIYNFLTKDDFGHFNIAPHSQCFPRCNRLRKYYDKNTIQKSSNWFILNRRICSLVINQSKTKIDEEYKKISSPEEHYFITTVFNNGLQTEIVATRNASCGATTFTNWKGMDYKYRSRRGLKNYSSITEEELLYLLNSKSLFGRKFNKECNSSLSKKEYINTLLSR